MKLDTDKCHTPLNSHKWLTKCNTTLTFDYKLTFNKHIDDICQKAPQK